MRRIPRDDFVGAIDKATWIDELNGVECFGTAVALITPGILCSLNHMKSVHTNMTYLVSAVGAGTFNESIRQEPDCRPVTRMKSELCELTWNSPRSMFGPWFASVAFRCWIGLCMLPGILYKLNDNQAYVSEAELTEFAREWMYGQSDQS